jgi:hypothetical protein
MTADARRRRRRPVRVRLLTSAAMECVIKSESQERGVKRKKGKDNYESL